MALAGLVIAVAGKVNTPSLQLSKLVKDNGGVFAHMITSSITHLITTEEEVRSSSYKISKAGEHGAILVTEKWLLECVKAKRRINESGYQLDTAPKAESPSYFSYADEFVSEAELREQQQREELEKATRRQQALASASQPVQASQKALSSAQPFAAGGGFGFGAASKTSVGSTHSAASTASSSNSITFLPTSEGAEASVIGGRVRRKPWPKSKGIAPKVKAWPDADPNRPRFTDDWEVEYFDTLQWTDVKTNHNKYYCLELHIGKDKGKQVVRLYTHYGRTDDLVKNPKAGRRENRFYSTLEQAEDAFAALIEEKTITKGYRKVELVFSNIGSEKLRALVSEMATKAESKSKPSSSITDSFVDTAPLTSEVTDLVRYIYDEASSALNNTLGPAKITSLGIETPLGVVNLAQIDRGEAILQRLYEMFKLGTQDEEAIDDLTNQFYTLIPHNLGRNRAQITSRRINSMAAFEEKQDLLQLMRDMLHVTSEGKTLGASDVDMKYRALRTKIELITSQTDSSKFEDVRKMVLESQGGDQSDLIDIKHIYAITRPAERTSFNQNRIQSNQRTLFHGSRISNFVGLLSRGLMMPKMVVAMGGKRRDGGLLGNGIYFGDSSATSAQYCSPGSKGTRLMLLNNVALGTVKEYEQVVFGLMEPPQGFHSVHGVKSSPTRRTDFKDDEYVIFNPSQQYQQYLVEFTLKKELDEFVTSQLFHNADGTTSIQMKSGAKTSVSNANAETSQSGPDSIKSTVDNIFASLLGGSNSETTSASATTGSRLGSSYKSKAVAGVASSTFTTPFSSMLTTPISSASDALRLQPSTLQTTGLLRPSTLSTSSTGPLGSGGLKLQPSGLDTTSPLLSGSLKLQPSGLTTSVKVAPLGSSFGRKSAGRTDSDALAAPSNAIQLPPSDPSLQSGTATGAAALLTQGASSGTTELTEEEKAAKRAAMKMGGKNFASRFTTPSAEPSVPAAATTSTPPSSLDDFTGYSYDALPTTSATTKTTPTPNSTPYSMPTSRPEAKLDDVKVYERKKRPSSEIADYKSTASSETISSSAMLPTKKYKLPTTVTSSKLSATTIGFPSTSSGWKSGTLATTSLLSSSISSPSAALSASVSGPSSKFGLGSSFLGLGASATSSGLGSSITSLSASATAFPPVRNAITDSTPHAKLSLYIPKSILKERLAESKIRALYQNERSSVLLKDHVQLVDLFKKREEMRNSLETPEEESMPKLLTRHRLPGPVIDSSSVRNAFGLAYDPLTQGNYCIVDFEQFKANFAALTLNVLAGLDLKNLCFFGDLVVGALLVNDGSSNNDQHITSAHFRDADIEIAILGLDGEAAAKKVRDIFFAVQSATKASCEIIRTQKEIIILGQYPVRNIRIPLRSFKGPAEVIFFQDVDVRCVGFDGNTVWALPRAQRALTKRYNLVDLALGHTTYEVNLYRWAKRGFAVAVPGFQRHLVTPHLLKQKPWQVRGLAKLLLLEVELNAQWAPPTPVGTALTFEPWTPKHQRFSVYSRDEFSLMRIHEFQALQKETYIEEKENIDAIDVDHHSVLFIPWGPQWRNSRVLKHLKFANSRFCESLVAMVGESGASEARPLVLFGLEAVLKGSVPSSVLDAAADIDEDWDDIDGSVRFHGDETSVTKDVLLERTVTSGAASFSTDTKAKRRQGSTGLRSSTASSNGSSNISSTVTPPNSEATTEEAWYYEAYCIKESAVEVTHAITDLAFAGLVSELSKLLRKLPRTYDVSHPSSYANGRTALNYAACNGSADAISALIAKGANPASVDSASGLSPIHFAAFSGNATAVEALLRHPSVDINAKTRDQRWTPLHFASYYGNTAALLVLLQDTKIRLNPRDKAGRSPVFVAAYAGHVKCLEMLKSAGAKMDTKAPPKTESGITALAIAAQNGHSEARSYLVELLKPAYPPLLQPSTESLAELEAGSSGSASGSSLLRSSLDSVTSRIANPREIAEWSMVDKFGQNMLHYAVKNGEVALVRQILSSALAQRSNGATSQVGDMDIAMPASISSFNLINIHAQNVYGQNALYYAQHLLDAFVGGKQLEEGDIPSTIEAIGIPTSVKTAACREIVGHLQRSGVKEAHLLPQRSLPDSQDDGMYQVMVRLARTARQIVKQADEARRQREAELEAEERSSRPLARTPIKRQRSNDSSSHSGPRLGLSPSSSSLAGAYSPHGRPHGGNGRPSLGLSASGRNHGIPGFVFSSSGAASPASFQDLASSNDTTQLLSTISQMHKTKQISDKDKIALKTLAMKQDRTLLSALRAFQHDHVSLAFGNTLRQIASYASSS